MLSAYRLDFLNSRKHPVCPRSSVHSSSVIADASGALKSDSDYYPWGGELQIVNNDPGNHYKFSGKERDSESQLDYFGARYYGNTLGRFMTPDWDGKPVTVPYAEFGDPQSLNLYSYVRNSPIARVDADGHMAVMFTSQGVGYVGGYGTSFDSDGLSDGDNPYADADRVLWVNAQGMFVLSDASGGSEGGGDGSGGVSVSGGSGQCSSCVSSVMSIGSKCPSCHDKLGDLDSREDNNTYRQNTNGEQGSENTATTKPTKNQGTRTEPNLPKKTVVEQDGVEIKHYTKSGDHGPAHLHVEGEGPSTRIGQNGKPIKGSPELSSTQQQVVNDNKGVIRKAIDQLMRWYNWNNQ